MSDLDRDVLAAAWDSGFDAACLQILTAMADAGARGKKAALADLKRVENPYRQEVKR